MTGISARLPVGFFVEQGILRLCCPHCGDARLRILFADIRPVLDGREASLALRCTTCAAAGPDGVMEFCIGQNGETVEASWPFNSPFSAGITQPFSPEGQGS